MSDLLNSLDPNMLNIGVAYMVIAVKYGAIYGILGTVSTMIIKAFSGKARFF